MLERSNKFQQFDAQSDRATTPPKCHPMTSTYITHCRRLALQESRALRGYARAGRRPPPSPPIDFWAEWQRSSHTNAHTFRKAA
jgi:hypothetical protein